MTREFFSTSCSSCKYTKWGTICKKPKDLHQEADPSAVPLPCPPDRHRTPFPHAYLYTCRQSIDPGLTASHRCSFRPLANRYSLSLASIILFPPILFTLFTSSPPESSAATSSPPPILLPLISTFGTVLRPVLFSRADCNSAPSECSSNSTTKGGGTIVYLSSKIAFAFFE